MRKLTSRMLTRPQLQAYLYALGFTASSPQPADDALLTYADLQVQLLDAPRLVVCSARGDVVYLAVGSAAQLETQLTDLLGYVRPLPPARL